MSVLVLPADLAAPELAALVDRHTAFCDGTAPAESCHRLAIDALKAPDITVWQAVLDGRVMGLGALKVLGDTDGEIKSMHTAKEARGRGVARAILQTIIAEAERREYRALWLETGVHPDFAPARALYAANGFVETGPFGSYKTDPHSTFMTLNLTHGGAAQ